MMKQTIQFLLILVSVTQSALATDTGICAFDRNPFWTTERVVSVIWNDQSSYTKSSYPFHRISVMALSQTEAGRKMISNSDYNHNGAVVGSLSEYDFDRLVVHLENMECNETLIQQLVTKYNRDRMNSEMTISVGGYIIPRPRPVFYDE